MRKYILLLFLLSFTAIAACTQEKPEDNTQTTDTTTEDTDNQKTQEKTSDNTSDKQVSEKPESEVDEYANTSLQAMFDFLANTQKLKVNVASTYDTLQKNGQLIEFGANTEWIIRRPDKVLINSVSWDSDDRSFYFDGKDITYYDSGYNVYAAAPKEGDLDQAFDYFVEKLNMPLPLTELFSVKHPFDLKTDLTFSSYLGESTINGVDCQEFTFRFPETDLQIWIRDGKQPLPERIVITYKDSPGQPQYKAQFSNWDLTSEMPDQLFIFKPPENSRKIIFATRSENTGKSPDKAVGGN